jgi:hypothetical protein
MDKSVDACLYHTSSFLRLCKHTHLYALHTYCNMDMPFCLQIESYRKAADVAIRARDPERLTEVLRVCRDPGLERYCQETLQKM